MSPLKANPSSEAKVTLLGCTWAAVPPDQILLRLEYAKSAHEVEAIESGRRRPRRMSMLLPASHAREMMNSISVTLGLLDRLNRH